MTTLDLNSEAERRSDELMAQHRRLMAIDIQRRAAKRDLWRRSDECLKRWIANDPSRNVATVPHS